MSDCGIYERRGSFIVNYPKQAVFPLLCPKTEESWIPGWTCEVLHSRTGRNEPGAVFKTHRPFGGEVIWYTREYDVATGVVEFINFGAGDFVFRFRIEVLETGSASCRLEFSHTFIPVSEAGRARVEAIMREDFLARLQQLGALLESHLSGHAFGVNE